VNDITAVYFRKPQGALPAQCTITELLSDEMEDRASNPCEPTASTTDEPAFKTRAERRPKTQS
jgi:hypothetical protein